MDLLNNEETPSFISAHVCLSALVFAVRGFYYYLIIPAIDVGRKLFLQEISVNE